MDRVEGTVSELMVNDFNLKICVLLFFVYETVLRWRKWRLRLISFYYPILCTAIPRKISTVKVRGNVSNHQNTYCLTGGLWALRMQCWNLVLR